MVITVSETVKNTAKTLADAGVFEPLFEAREIVREYFGKDAVIYGNESISEDISEKIASAIKRRVSGEPLQYIFGHWEFYGYDFSVGKGVLIPRPETELLVDIAVSHCDNSSRVLDLCSGSGCIPISISLKTGADCTAVELYDDAFSYLTENIAKHNALVKAVQGDVLNDVLPEKEKFDIILSNPPYLTGGEMNELQKEVSFEPSTALFGGDDGLIFYRKIIPLWKKHLKAGGVFAVEIGETQGESVKAIMENCGFTAEIIKDYAGNGRVVIGK